MGIMEMYDKEIDRIENSDMTPEEKAEETHLLDKDMREHDEERRARHEEIDRQYGY